MFLIFCGSENYCDNLMEKDYIGKITYWVFLMCNYTILWWNNFQTHMQSIYWIYKINAVPYTFVYLSQNFTIKH